VSCRRRACGAPRVCAREASAISIGRMGFPRFRLQSALSRSCLPCVPPLAPPGVTRSVPRSKSGFDRGWRSRFTGKRKRPGLMGPPGASRFSTLFNVAAIGGKSPRAFDCVWNTMASGPLRQAREVYRSCCRAVRSSDRHATHALHHGAFENELPATEYVVCVFCGLLFFDKTSRAMLRRRLA
jgi:hypothetical protein